MLPWSSLVIVAVTVAPLAAQADEEGLGAHRGDPVLPPPAALTAGPRPSRSDGSGGVLFVNFDGATLTDGGEDSRVNKTLMGFTGAFERYGDGPKREAVMQALAADWAAYDMEVTQTRPDEGDYTMAMVGPTNFTDGSLGIAHLDCDNAWTPNNIVYAFHSLDDEYSAAATATTISQEVAHSYGLEHVEDPSDIMHPWNLGGDAGFTDQCTEIIPAEFGIKCHSQHERECGSDHAQNGHGELLRLLGGAGADTEAPVVTIESPQDGDVFTVGGSFEVRATATDDHAVTKLRLYDGAAMLAEDTLEPFGWQIASLVEGELRLVVEAVDDAGNVGVSQEIVVGVVVGDEPGRTPEPDAGEDEADGRATGEPWPDGEGDGRRIRFRALDEPGCRMGGPVRRAPVGLLVLFLLGGRRRR